MNDSTERAPVAPVAYLPWVQPAEGAGGDEGHSDSVRAPSEQAADSVPAGGVAERLARLDSIVARSKAPVFVDTEEESEIAPDEIELIADRLVRRLGRKGLSVAEAEHALLADGVPEVEAAEIIERFVRFGYLDDDNLASHLVLGLRERKRLGRSAIMAELRARKLSEESIALALAEVGDDDELALATEVAEKRAGQLRSLAPEVAQRRLTAFLLRRGYSSSTVQAATRAVLPRSSSGRRGPGDPGGVRFR